MTPLKRIRTITSHAGYARWLAYTAHTPAGYLPRQADIPSPYHYSPTWTVWQHDIDGTAVVVETRHKHYEVFAVPPQLIRATEEEICMTA